HRCLAHTAAPENSHHPLCLVLQELANETGLNVAVLKVMGCNTRRRIDELTALEARDRLRRLPLAFDAAFDALLDTLLCLFGVFDDPLLLRDLALQFFDVVLDADALRVAGLAREVVFRNGKPIP